MSSKILSMMCFLGSTDASGGGNKPNKPDDSKTKTNLLLTSRLPSSDGPDIGKPVVTLTARTQPDEINVTSLSTNRVRAAKDIYGQPAFTDHQACTGPVTVWRSSNKHHDDFVASVMSNCPVKLLELSNDDGKASCEFYRWIDSQGPLYFCRAPGLTGTVVLTPYVTYDSAKGPISGDAVTVVIPDRQEVIPKVGDKIHDGDLVEVWGNAPTGDDFQLQKNGNRVSVDVTAVAESASYVLTLVHSGGLISWSQKTEVPSQFKWTFSEGNGRYTLYAVVRNSKKAVIKNLRIDLN